MSVCKQKRKSQRMNVYIYHSLGFSIPINDYLNDIALQACLSFSKRSEIIKDCMLLLEMVK